MEKINELSDKFKEDVIYPAEEYVSKVCGENFKSKGTGTSASLGYFVGIFTGIGLGLFWLSDNYVDFGLYIAFLSFFHFSEYITVAMYNPKELSSDSFLINHSDAYTIAFVSCLSEYFIESFFLSFLKNNWYIYYFGLLIALSGLILRLVGMHTAKASFTHLVKYEKRNEHILITNGIYQFTRHPGYVGWFLYTVGTQIILCNPICAIGFGFVAYKFFEDRLIDEEEALVEMFGESYEIYREKVPIIPFFIQEKPGGIVKRGSIQKPKQVQISAPIKAD